MFFDKAQVPKEIPLLLEEVNGLKVKCELVFIGRNGEVEVYTEFAYSERKSDTKHVLAFKLASEFINKPIKTLEFNDKVINTNYYTLTVVNIVDVSYFKMKVNQYGERVFK